MVKVEQQRAFVLVADTMRKKYGRCSEAELFAEAVAALKGTAPLWSDGERNQAAKYISRSIANKFDSTKSRLPPSQSRGEKARRDREILKFATSHEKGSISAESVAKKFLISKTTAYNILRKGGYYRKLSSRCHSLSDAAFQIVSLFADQLSSDSYRMIDLNSIRRSIRCSDFDATSVFNEVNTSSQPLQLHILPALALDGASKWVVVERGRRKSKEFLVHWALRHSHWMLSRPRLRTDQSIVLNLRDAIAPENPVLHDAAAVIQVAHGSESIQVWRRFIEASTVIGESRNFIGIDDPGSFQTALNGAIRRQSLEDLLPKMSGWLNSPLDRSGGKKLFSLARMLRNVPHKHPLDAFKVWAERTAYRQRIEQNLLPLRSVVDLDRIVLFEHILDLDEVLDAFWRNPSDRVSPEFLWDDDAWEEDES